MLSRPSPSALFLSEYELNPRQGNSRGENHQREQEALRVLFLSFRRVWGK